MARIAITGATGFVGSRLCQDLLARGFSVRALIRSRQRATALLDPAIELTPGSLQDHASLKALLIDVDAVVHCAGAVRGHCAADFDSLNVNGTRCLLEAISVNKTPPYLVNLSSLAAREPTLSHYAASKRAGERLLSEDFSDLPAVSLRPPAIYGPGDREMLPLFRAMAKGLAPLPGPATARVSLIHVDDLLAAIAACLSSTPQPGGVFEVDDGHLGGYDWREVAQIVSALCKRRVNLLPLPAPLLDTVAHANRHAARTLGYAPMLTPEKLRELRHPDWVSDSSALQAATGWRPRLGLSEGLRRTPVWR